MGWERHLFQKYLEVVMKKIGKIKTIYEIFYQFRNNNRPFNQYMELWIINLSLYINYFQKNKISHLKNNKYI